MPMPMPVPMPMSMPSVTASMGMRLCVTVGALGARHDFWKGSCEDATEKLDGAREEKRTKGSVKRRVRHRIKVSGEIHDALSMQGSRSPGRV
ncbi:hypothetical protein E4U42_002733 [Claviceps africana]|uniref:Uncharacterized protein n=1 Tax=Claviceps africana TaxID=83212 RepID=A0A8K0JD47_9HYPO|nr:hypothetical protein E4U42_002733 [Claviceps africana]